MGKQKHDLGVRKRAINALNNPERSRPDKPLGSFAIGPHWPGGEEPRNLYGPPSDIRDKAHALRQVGQPTEAQAIIDRWHFGHPDRSVVRGHREYDKPQRVSRGKEAKRARHG